MPLQLRAVVKFQCKASSSRFIFRTYLSTEKILYLECAILCTKSLNRTERFVKKLGKRPVIRAWECTEPFFSVSISYY